MRKQGGCAGFWSEPLREPWRNSEQVVQDAGGRGGGARAPLGRQKSRTLNRAVSGARPQANVEDTGDGAQQEAGHHQPLLRGRAVASVFWKAQWPSRPRGVSSTCYGYELFQRGPEQRKNTG